jgi:Pyruvate/2-oxoacid:ferredoxin oxidoreductase delta subunit
MEDNMVTQDIPFHYVCTWDEARKLVDSHTRFWVSNCGCRERRGSGCARSSIEVCLMFNEDEVCSGSGMREATRAEVDALLRQAEAKFLVTRPFRNEHNMAETSGICFCCDDCCGYFLDPTEKCDRGALIEITDFNVCTHCGVCVDVCYFLTRTMVENKLNVDREYCFGCGLCVAICPEKCIKMIRRV